MEINQIKIYLNSSDSQERLKAIAALRSYDSNISVPLLKSKIDDQEFVVRSFIAMSVGKKRSLESFTTLLDLMINDKDANVRAEAANSLSMFGQVAVDHLVSTFKQDANWLVRSSIIIALRQMHCKQELLEVVIRGLQGEHKAVVDIGLDTLRFLSETDQKEKCIDQLLLLRNHDWWRIRARAARALIIFKDDLRAKLALHHLRNDSHYRVVAAGLESLI